MCSKRRLYDRQFKVEAVRSIPERGKGAIEVAPDNVGKLIIPALVNYDFGLLIDFYLNFLYNIILILDIRRYCSCGKSMSISIWMLW